MDFRETFTLSDSVYNKLKYTVLIILPALATLIGVIGITMHLPYIEVIVTLMNAVTAFLGAVLGVSTHNYNNSIK